MTTYSVVVLRRADGDVEEIHDWLARRSPAGAACWYAAFLATSESR